MRTRDLLNHFVKTKRMARGTLFKYKRQLELEGKVASKPVHKRPPYNLYYTPETVHARAVLLLKLIEEGSVGVKTTKSQKKYYYSIDAELVKTSQRINQLEREKNVETRRRKAENTISRRLYIENFYSKNLQGFCFTCRFFKPNPRTGKGNRNCQYPGKLFVTPKGWKTGISNAKCNMWELEPDPHQHVLNGNIVFE